MKWFSIPMMIVTTLGNLVTGVMIWTDRGYLAGLLTASIFWVGMSMVHSWNVKKAAIAADLAASLEITRPLRRP